MNNEPVAWMIKTLDGKMLMLYGQEQPPKFESKVQYIPLYTHPVKELTDERITAISKKIFKDYKNFHHYQLDFARAVIKEANEK